MFVCVRSVGCSSKAQGAARDIERQKERTIRELEVIADDPTLLLEVQVRLLDFIAWLRLPCGLLPCPVNSLRCGVTLYCLCPRCFVVVALNMCCCVRVPCRRRSWRP